MKNLQAENDLKKEEPCEVVIPSPAQIAFFEGVIRRGEADGSPQATHDLVTDDRGLTKLTRKKFSTC